MKQADQTPLRASSTSFLMSIMTFFRRSIPTHSSAIVVAERDINRSNSVSTSALASCLLVRLFLTSVAVTAPSVLPSALATEALRGLFVFAEACLTQYLSEEIFTQKTLLVPLIVSQLAKSAPWTNSMGSLRRMKYAMSVRDETLLLRSTPLISMVALRAFTNSSRLSLTNCLHMSLASAPTRIFYMPSKCTGSRCEPTHEPRPVGLRASDITNVRRIRDLLHVRVQNAHHCCLGYLRGDIQPSFDCVRKYRDALHGDRNLRQHNRRAVRNRRVVPETKVTNDCSPALYMTGRASARNVVLSG